MCNEKLEHTKLTTHLDFQLWNNLAYLFGDWCKYHTQKRTKNPNYKKYFYVTSFIKLQSFG